MNIKTLLKLRQENLNSGLPAFEGMDSSEIGSINRYFMFGENDEAFPGQEEWSYIVDWILTYK